MVPWLSGMPGGRGYRSRPDAIFWMSSSCETENRDAFSDAAFVTSDKFPPPILEELAAAGFVEIRRAKFSTDIERVIVGAGTDDFAWRARSLRRHHLLDADRPLEISRYVDEVFSGYELAIADLPRVARGRLRGLSSTR